ARVVADDFEDIVAEVARVAGDEAQALDGGDLVGDSGEQVGGGGGVGAGEGGAAVAAGGAAAFLGLGVAVEGDGGAVLEAVVVDGLAQEGDLDDAGVGQALALVDDVVGGAVDLGAAGEGDDAVGAELVAAARDADVGGALGGVVVEGRDG